MNSSAQILRALETSCVRTSEQNGAGRVVQLGRQSGNNRPATVGAV